MNYEKILIFITHKTIHKTQIYITNNNNLSDILASYKNNYTYNINIIFSFTLLSCIIIKLISIL